MEEDIDNVVIVGGSNRIPNVKSLFKDFFDSILAEIWATQSPDHRYDRPFPFVRFPIKRDPPPPPSAILGITLAVRSLALAPLPFVHLQGHRGTPAVPFYRFKMPQPVGLTHSHHAIESSSEPEGPQTAGIGILYHRCCSLDNAEEAYSSVFALGNNLDFSPPPPVNSSPTPLDFSPQLVDLPPQAIRFNPQKAHGAGWETFSLPAPPALLRAMDGSRNSSASHSQQARGSQKLSLLEDFKLVEEVLKDPMKKHLRSEGATERDTERDL
ncbi:hypothetical protein FRC00_008663 [Tulasnella sp. 408]|nr:hypothetical protein FRC00_008663 [Tulasnella sp. 408]